jgi:hypothetical protein
MRRSATSMDGFFGDISINKGRRLPVAGEMYAEARSRSSSAA